jgi:hypothetical protein
LVGFDVVRIALLQAVLFFTIQSKRKRVGHFLRNRVLNSKDVCEFFVEGARPHQLKSPVAQQKGMEVLTAGLKAQAA